MTVSGAQETITNAVTDWEGGAGAGASYSASIGLGQFLSAPARGCGASD